VDHFSTGGAHDRNLWKPFHHGGYHWTDGGDGQPQARVARILRTFQASDRTECPFSDLFVNRKIPPKDAFFYAFEFDAKKLCVGVKKMD